MYVSYRELCMLGPQYHKHQHLMGLACGYTEKQQWDIPMVATNGKILNMTFSHLNRRQIGCTFSHCYAKSHTRTSCVVVFQGHKLLFY